MIVHLIDGTYELFRHFYGLRRLSKGEDAPFGAVLGVWLLDEDFFFYHLAGIALMLAGITLVNRTVRPA